jgi:hypothetical protein
MESSISLCVCVTWNLACLKSPSSNEYTLPFIVQGRCLYYAGPRQVGPANRILLYAIWRSPSPAPRCSLHSWEDNVRIHSLDTVVRCLAGTVTAVSVTQQWSRVATVGSESVRRGGSADPRAVASACIVAAHASTLLLQAIITPRVAP